MRIARQTLPIPRMRRNRTKRRPPGAPQRTPIRHQRPGNVVALRKPVAVIHLLRDVLSLQSARLEVAPRRRAIVSPPGHPHVIDLLAQPPDLVVHQRRAVEVRAIEFLGRGDVSGAGRGDAAGFELDGLALDGRGVPGALPAPGALLACFEELGLVVGDPFGAALEVCAEEVADAVGVLEGLDVDGEGGEDLEDAVEEDPAAEAGFAGGGIFEVGAELELLELVDERVAADGGIELVDVGGVAEDDGELEVGFCVFRCVGLVLFQSAENALLLCNSYLGHISRQQWISMRDVGVTMPVVPCN